MRRTITDMAREAADRLRAGETVEIQAYMGSCQYGSHSGEVTVRDGVVVAKCDGYMAWQKYNGPAKDCAVAYGWGPVAKLIAAYYDGPVDENNPTHRWNAICAGGGTSIRFLPQFR